MVGLVLYPEQTGIRFGTNWNKVRYVPIGCRSSVTTNIARTTTMYRIIAVGRTLDYTEVVLVRSRSDTEPTIVVL